MGYIKAAFWIIIWAVVAGFLHYVLPQHDVVRITDTYEKRVNVGANAMFWAKGDAGSGDAGQASRDVFFIQAFQQDGAPMVYRNEDTGWGWPPYFKFDTSNLQAQAADLVSKKTDETIQWVKITHYGWRNEYFSIYPNATEVAPMADPNATIIPWFNIVFLTLVAAMIWALWVRWVRFRENRIDPAIEGLEDRWDEASDSVADAGGWLRGLFSRKS